MLALSLSNKFSCFGILLLVFVNEFVIFSFFTIYILVNENHTGVDSPFTPCNASFLPNFLHCLQKEVEFIYHWIIHPRFTLDWCTPRYATTRYSKRSEIDDYIYAWVFTIITCEGVYEEWIERDVVILTESRTERWKTVAQLSRSCIATAVRQVRTYSQLSVWIQPKVNKKVLKN